MKLIENLISCLAGKVWFTINARIYTGEENTYQDAHVAAPIVAVACPVLGGLAGLPVGAATAGSLAPSGRKELLIGADGKDTAVSLSPTTAGATGVTITKEDAEKIIEKLTLSSPGWYMGSDRSLCILGGPSNVQRESDSFQRILLEDVDVPRLYIADESSIM